MKKKHTPVLAFGRGQKFSWPFGRFLPKRPRSVAKISSQSLLAFGRSQIIFWPFLAKWPRPNGQKKCYTT